MADKKTELPERRGSDPLRSRHPRKQDEEGRQSTSSYKPSLDELDGDWPGGYGDYEPPEP